MKMTGKSWFTLVLLLAFVFLFSKSWQVGNSRIPKIGFFFSPFTGFWQNAEASTKMLRNETIDIPGLKDRVVIELDDRCVPHIFAKNETDLIRIQGYLHAKYRLWQMDISTRAIEGTVSEILGSKALNHDKETRRKGLGYAAEVTAEAWKNTTENQYLEAYADGVNAYVASLSAKEYPVEFKLLDYEPQKWSPYRTALMYKAMANDLTSRTYDIEFSNAVKLFGKETFDFLYPERRPEESPIIPRGTAFTKSATQPESDNIIDTLSGEMGYRNGTLMENPPENIGSNNWAIGRDKSISGNPILSGDPHLALNLPSIWYENHLNSTDINVYGVSIPGVPFVVIGFNDHIAWSVTNGEHDVLDWYKIKWTDENNTKYLLDGKEKEVQWRVENIKVRGGHDVADSVRYTTWGPIVSDDPKSPYVDLAMKWIVLDKPDDNELKVFHGINKSKNYTDFKNALLTYSNPIQNFVFASGDGDIALHTQGKLPLKSPGQGRIILDGSESKNEWHGFIPAQDMPHVLNPPRGFVSSANQTTTDSTYPYYYYGNFADFRGRYLNRALEKMNNASPDDMIKLQYDAHGLMPEELLPEMITHLDRSKIDEAWLKYLDTLHNWNFLYSSQSQGAALFDLWAKSFHKMTWDEMTMRSDSIKLITPEPWKTIQLLKTNPDNVFFDLQSTPEKETSADILLLSFKSAMHEADSIILKNKKLTWRSYENLDIMHLTRLPTLSDMGVSTDGAGRTLNAVHDNRGPSWRMVVELSSPVKAYGLYPAGQSGNPGSVWYDNMIKKWSQGKLDELRFPSAPGELGKNKIQTIEFKHKA